MGNQYSYTSRIASQGPWWTNLNPAKLVAIAGSAVIQTAQVGGKAVATVVATPFISDSGRVPINVSNVSDEIAIYITIYATWIQEGAYMGPLSSITGTLTGSPITHWFAAIETNDPNVWYWAELNVNGVRLKKCSSKGEVKKWGCKSGDNPKAENFTQKMGKSCYRSLGTIKSWVENSNNYYHLNWHNCQHWAEELYNWI